VEGLITPGLMIAGSILMGPVLSPIDQLIAVWRQWSGARQAYQRLARLLEENPPAALGMPLPAPRGAGSGMPRAAGGFSSSSRAALHWRQTAINWSMGLSTRPIRIEPA
ncbi:hypothetical protein ACV355_31945, partial [Pseudomonas aeruginosa]